MSSLCLGERRPKMKGQSVSALAGPLGMGLPIGIGETPVELRPLSASMAVAGHLPDFGQTAGSRGDISGEQLGARGRTGDPDQQRLVERQTGRLQAGNPVRRHVATC